MGNRRRRPDPLALGLVVGYAFSIYLANWLLFNVGTPSGGGLRTIPVWLGIDAPSGVLAAGATLTLRDAVQRASGLRASVIAVVSGSLLTTVISPAAALASGMSFFVAEMLDLAVYTRLRRRFYVAVSVSNVVGALVDSLVFLTLAFGWSAALSFAGPSVLGKFEASLITLGLLSLLRSARSFGRPPAAVVPLDMPMR